MDCAKLTQGHRALRREELKLDMSRGVPGADQLALSSGLLTCLTAEDCAAGGIDARNYGAPDGLPEARTLMGAILGVPGKEVVIGGSSSLNLMYDTMVRALLFGVSPDSAPWSKLPKVTFLCPSPGYDRHFAICELLGFDMIAVPMTGSGPDMDRVEELVSSDSAVKGIWCVPKYSNPDGITYSDETVRRLAAMKTAAPDFRIFWDNAYAVHDLYGEGDALLNIADECREAGTYDRVYQFASMSKVTLAGGGITCLAASEANLAHIRQSLSKQAICQDKVNQLRHVRFLRDLDGVKAHMQKHAALLRPKFAAVLGTLERELGPLGIARWNAPRGGYFVSLNVMPGTAKRVVQLCKEAGVTLTPAGATFPYGHDPKDSNIRIAPTSPAAAELEQAMARLCEAVIQSIK
jgi:DNA-binding transcriptional MocR family regulator